MAVAGACGAVVVDADGLLGREDEAVDFVADLGG